MIEPSVKNVTVSSSVTTVKFVSDEPAGFTLNVGLLSLVSSHSNFWFVSMRAFFASTLFSDWEVRYQKKWLKEKIENIPFHTGHNYIFCISICHIFKSISCRSFYLFIHWAVFFMQTFFKLHNFEVSKKVAERKNWKWLYNWNIKNETAKKYFMRFTAVRQYRL